MHGAGEKKERMQMRCPRRVFYNMRSAVHARNTTRTNNARGTKDGCDNVEQVVRTRARSYSMLARALINCVVQGVERIGRD